MISFDIERDLHKRNILMIECEADVSSGTYIRSLCERMGGLAYDIKRVCVL